jgi:uncharacterized protein DUF1569
MRHFDADFIREFLERFDAIQENSTPKWGTLRRATLIEHLIWILRHAMGRSDQVPYFGNWFTRNIVGRAFLAGLLRIPKNVKFPKYLTSQGITAREPGDIETLEALLEEYLNLVQADELKPAPHPVFGDIGVDGWDYMHVVHFEHHLKQFGV